MENNLTPKQALEKLKENEINIYYHLPWDILEEYYIIIDQALTEIENQKQILEILKNVSCIKISKENGRYFIGSHDWWRDITKEQYYLLKEWLKNGK